MEYNTYDPSPDLASFIKCFWSLKVPQEASGTKQQILPDGCLEMIFNLGDDIKRYTDSDDFIIQPASFVMGQLTKPFFIEPTGDVDTFAARFYPGGFGHFVKIPLQDLSNKETEFSGMFDPNKAKDLVENIRESRNIADRISIVEEFLLSIIDKNIDSNELINATIDTILSTKGTLGIEEIIGSSKSKRRQLERKFSSMVGLSPKQLCRIIRLQSSLQLMLKNDGMDLTQIGNESQYFDQSHFIKDFRDFTGISPRKFYADEKFTLSSIFYAQE